MSVATEIQASMELLLAEAERSGQWLFTQYQGIWFSPAELRKNQADGRFLWGPVNWQLRHPSEYIDQHRAAVARAEAELARVIDRVNAS